MPGDNEQHKDVSYHRVPFPPGVGYASVSCSTTCGQIRLTRTTAAEPATVTFLPDSPIYNIQNSSCAGNLILPLEPRPGLPLVVLITFDNNSTAEGVVTVVVALSFPPEDKQQRVFLRRKLPAKQSTTVHVVFVEV
jgi:hypothetical protein